MKLLLDTHTFLWFILGDASLSLDARVLIEEPNNQKFVSIAGVWEIAIKVSIGKMNFAAPFDPFIENQMKINGFKLHRIEFGHTAIVSNLTFHHKDPFDRIIIAQAMFRKMPIISADAVFDAYPVNLLW